MDNDGDLDIVSVSVQDSKIAWYENNGDGSSWTAAVITTSESQVYGVFVADIDGDGDMDIVSASWDDDTIAWHENAGIPEFSNIMMPIVSVLAIVGFNYRRRKINQDE